MANAIIIIIIIMVKIMVKIMVPTTKWRTMVAQGGSQLKMFAPGRTSESSSSP